MNKDHCAYIDYLKTVTDFVGIPWDLVCDFMNKDNRAYMQTI
jgi:hypothetical protein